jgi:hypothetical protein
VSAKARPYPPAEVYQAYLAQADVFIGLYWQRYGQLVPGAQVSGLEEEFDLSAGLPRLLYVKGPAPDRQPRLAAGGQAAGVARAPEGGRGPRRWR